MATKLEEIHITPTNNTPEVLLNADGVIKIFGRAIDESRTKFSDQMMTWIDAYIVDAADSTEVTIALEYLNSFNSIYLASVLRKLAQVKEQQKRLKVKWYIEDDDEDLLERAEYISTTFNIPIEFEMTDHIKNWY
jgi:hypothetical protein